MKSIFFGFSIILATLAGCDSEVSSQSTPKFDAGERLSELTDDRLREASGLAASVKNPGRLWTLNDSGNEPEVYLVDKELKISMTIRLAGVANRDWEDIAVGSGPDSTLTYIYVADIGDNDAVYPHKYIFRFPEPKLGASDHVVISDFERITFELEDGMKDSESLLIDPRSENLYVVSKREFPVSVYEFAWSATTGDTVTASKVASLPMFAIVAADCFERNGDILMKNYTNIYYWENKDNLDVISLLNTTPQQVPYEAEPQGESIAWANDGSGFFTLSERKGNQPTYLYFYSQK